MREAASEHGAVVRATTARLTPLPGPLPASGARERAVDPLAPRQRGEGGARASGRGRGGLGPTLAPAAGRIYTARTRCPEEGQKVSVDVADWLRRLGLEQYASAFASNDIDGEILPELTADDLIGLGVTSIGHRRRLLAAIAALRSEPPGPVAETRPAAPATSSEAERRQLTVMFCDLVGSTVLSTRFDPEDLREMIGDYHRAVADTVGRFDGFVAKYMGDGVLIYFGYPQAHEDDAERAVRAGLAVIEAVGRLPAREDLRVRLGIATGLAVVGDLIGAGAAQERGVVGETPNLAARLQGLAEPNTLVVAEGTRRQIGGLFDLADLRAQARAAVTTPSPPGGVMW